MNLNDRVLRYYTDNFDTLPIDKQFHFATRLDAWQNLPFAHDKLNKMRSYVFPDQDVKASLANLLNNPPEGKINAVGLRQSYFSKYPDLRPLMLVLFRVRHLRDIYDINVIDTLLDLVPEHRLDALASQLLGDSDALCILSTYAINYLYLLRHILFPSENNMIDIEKLYEVSRATPANTPAEIQLQIYFYTHCIIGESNFYKWPIRSEHSKIYMEMIADLEKLITNNFEDINLDNKLEFLVCCRIMGYTPALAEEIYQECSQSISKDGVFLVDRLNNLRQSDKTSFADSEHRNVLFIMSHSAYPQVT
ncbi:hypothetical protein KC968_03760 [Candidatus Saccharibacteria bacterium]|nr:hypothetical protein [Candidatus Saccharibacteria bacterium]